MYIYLNLHFNSERLFPKTVFPLWISLLSNHIFPHTFVLQDRHFTSTFSARLFSANTTRRGNAQQSCASANDNSLISYVLRVLRVSLSLMRLSRGRLESARYYDAERCSGWIRARQPRRSRMHAERLSEEKQQIPRGECARQQEVPICAGLRTWWNVARSLKATISRDRCVELKSPGARTRKFCFAVVSRFVLWPCYSGDTS